MIQLSKERLDVVQKILAPYPHRFFVFGSRAKNKAKTLSDLDLCIKSEQPVPLRILAEIETQFEESDLPFKVDVK